jgi:hypothetical protein
MLCLNRTGRTASKLTKLCIADRLEHQEGESEEKTIADP